MISVRAGIFASCLLLGPMLASASSPPRFSTERINGRNYVRIQDVISYYGFNQRWIRNRKTIILKKKYAVVKLQIDSREISINKDNQDIKIWLNFAPAETNQGVFISELDIIKTLDSVLRPWAVRESPIRTIMIDPGHGGPDDGTLGSRRGVVEKEFALDVGKRVGRILKKAGFKVLMTRRTDQFVSLEDRAEQANVSSADMFISIHFNSASPNRGPRGFETYCLTPAGAGSTGAADVRLSDYRSNPGNRTDARNMLLAFCIHHALVTRVNRRDDRGVKRARFVVLKETAKPATLLELGFLSNRIEEGRIKSSDYREKLAQSICAGIIKYVSYVNPQKSAASNIKLRDVH